MGVALRTGGDWCGLGGCAGVVEQVGRDPLSAEVWWYTLSALRLESEGMESDELIGLIEEALGAYENNLSQCGPHSTPAASLHTVVAAFIGQTMLLLFPT